RRRPGQAAPPAGPGSICSKGGGRGGPGAAAGAGTWTNATSEAAARATRRRRRIGTRSVERIAQRVAPRPPRGNRPAGGGAVRRRRPGGRSPHRRLAVVKNDLAVLPLQDPAAGVVASAYGECTGYPSGPSR